MRTGTAVLFAIASLASPGAAQLPFAWSGWRAFPPERFANAPVSLADFDGDGDLDAVATWFAPTGDRQRFFRNDGHGVFAPSAAWPDAVVGGRHLVADVDGDGDPDVLVSGALLRNTNGTFTTQGSVPGRPLACADFDGDGVKDLLTARANDLGIDLWLRTSTGFVPAPVPTNAMKPVEAAARDFDGDGDTDLLIAADRYVIPFGPNWSGVDRLWVNDGLGGFTETPLPGSPNGSTLSLAVADFDGDGDHDAVILTPSLAGWYEYRRNDGAGTLALVPNTLPTPLAASWLRPLDADGDGDVDLAGAGWWLANDGTGTFTAALVPASARFGQLQSTGDVDGDGDQDLVFAGAADDGSTRLLLAEPGPSWTDASARPWSQPLGAVAIGDLDGDGDPDALGWQQADLCTNDGTGWFEQRAFPWGVGQTSSVVRLADADADGDPDVLFCHTHPTNGNQLRLVRNDGSAGFTDVGQGGMPAVAPSFTLLAAFDANGDGFADVLGSALGTPLQLYRGNGVGGFTAVPAAFPPVVDRWSAAAAADFDLDGDLDVLTAEADYTLQGGDLRWWRNDAGVFTDVSAQQLQAPTALALAVVSGDVDADGDVDVVVACWGTPSYPNSVNLLLRNDGTGRLVHVPGALPAVLPDGTAALGDLDGDGDLDLVAGTYTNGVRLWRNQGAPGFVDAGEVAPDRTPTLLHCADVDRDGDVDVLQGPHVHLNRTVHLQATHPCRVGRPFPLDYAAAAAGFAVPFLGVQSAPLALPTPFGTLAVDPLAAFVLAAVPLGSGAATVIHPMPPSPGLVGVDFVVQALFAGPSLRLSPAVRVTVRS